MMSTFGWMSGLPALPIAAMRPSFDVGDDRVDRALRARHLRLSHAVADHLAAAELHFLAVGGEVLLDLDEEFGVGEANLIAGCRTEHIGISGAGHLHGQPRRQVVSGAPRIETRSESS
jgi:hypothetical protein